ncbi:MAG: nuclear transport factor 2 family protein [Caulobacteraceae bacterium]
MAVADVQMEENRMKLASTTAPAVMAAMVFLAAPGVSAAAQGGGAREGDRAQIAELMWNYTRALDTLNEEAYVRAYVPDGAFGKTKGHEALRKMVVDLKKGQADRAAKGEPAGGAMHHIETNEHIEFPDRDHARYHYYWMTVFGAPPGGPPGGQARIAAVGHGVDDLVRVKGKWLIKMRNVSPTGGED